MRDRIGLTVIAASLFFGVAARDGVADEMRYGFGAEATAADIAAIDIDVMPDGRGAPPGEGSHAQGREVYMARCAGCHGEALQGVKEAGGAPLIGGRGSLGSGTPKKTVESYWPFASTLFDYTKRAMPFDAPGSLTDAEVYAVVAFILGEAGIVDKDAMLNGDAIARVEMPNRDGFVLDSRPDVSVGK